MRDVDRVPDDIKRDVALFNYREAFKLSGKQMLDEPQVYVDEAFFMWELQSRRVTLNTERQKKR